jgi:hypothetical protein
MKGLQFTPDYYKEKLILFAKDTVEVEGFFSLFNCKENSKGHPTVVEVFEDHFRICTFTNSAHNKWDENYGTSERDLFYANVYFRENEISIETFWKKGVKIFALIGFLFILCLGIFGNFTSLILLFPFLILFISLKITKKRYKKFILLFLESI